MNHRDKARIALCVRIVAQAVGLNRAQRRGSKLRKGNTNCVSQKKQWHAGKELIRDMIRAKQK